MHILTGDFNCVLDKEIDRYSSRNYDDTVRGELLSHPPELFHKFYHASIFQKMYSASLEHILH
jgi:hypothetical protein